MESDHSFLSLWLVVLVEYEITDVVRFGLRSFYPTALKFANAMPLALRAGRLLMSLHPESHSSCRHGVLQNYVPRGHEDDGQRLRARLRELREAEHEEHRNAPGTAGGGTPATVRALLSCHRGVRLMPPGARGPRQPTANSLHRPQIAYAPSQGPLSPVPSFYLKHRVARVVGQSAARSGSQRVP